MQSSIWLEKAVLTGKMGSKGKPLNNNKIAQPKRISQMAFFRDR